MRFPMPNLSQACYVDVCWCQITLFFSFFLQKGLRKLYVWRFRLRFEQKMHDLPAPKYDVPLKKPNQAAFPFYFLKTDAKSFDLHWQTKPKISNARAFQKSSEVQTYGFPEACWNPRKVSGYHCKRSKNLKTSLQKHGETKKLCKILSCPSLPSCHAGGIKFSGLMSSDAQWARLGCEDWTYTSSPGSKSITDFFNVLPRPRPQVFGWVFVSFQGARWMSPTEWRNSILRSTWSAMSTSSAKICSGRRSLEGPRASVKTLKSWREQRNV